MNLELLWVTRSTPFNHQTARRLQATGHDVLKEPLFEIRPLRPVSEVQRPDFLAFTSFHGVKHHPHRAQWNDLPVFAVGDTTAAAVRSRGYRNVLSASGNVRDLATLVLRSVPAGSRLTHFSASKPAGDLASYLRCRGIRAERHAVYEAVQRPIADLKAALTRLPDVTGIVVHSPRIGQRAADLAANNGWSGTVYCLSEACAEPFRLYSRARILVADRPTERALLALIPR